MNSYDINITYIDHNDGDAVKTETLGYECQFEGDTWSDEQDVIAETIADFYGMFRLENMPEFNNDLEAFIKVCNEKSDAIDNIHITHVDIDGDDVYTEKEEDAPEADPAEEMYDIFDKGLSDTETSEEQ